MQNLQVHVWKINSINAHYELEKLDIGAEHTMNSASREIIPSGAYTTFRTFQHRKVLPMDSHFERLEQSARLAHTDVLLRPEEIRFALREVLDDTLDWPELRFRITLDLKDKPGTIYLSVEKLITPTIESYQTGAKAISCSFSRKNPKAKLTNHLSVVKEVNQSMPADIEEALMISDENLILEGLTSNFFAIRDGILYTPEDDVLFGIIRKMVLTEAELANIPVDFSARKLTNAQKFEEAFITSASRLILPIVSIDNVQIGNGKPGKITRDLYSNLEKSIYHDLEDI